LALNASATVLSRQTRLPVRCQTTEEEQRVKEDAGRVAAQEPGIWRPYAKKEL
jgi:hypothetical protein